MYIKWNPKGYIRISTLNMKSLEKLIPKVWPIIEWSLERLSILQLINASLQNIYNDLRLYYCPSFRSVNIKQKNRGTGNAFVAGGKRGIDARACSVEKLVGQVRAVM